MNMNEGLEEHIIQLSVSLKKLSYLIGILNQRLEKESSALTEQEKTLFLYERDNMRINLDIANDYIQESASTLKNLRETISV